MKEEIPVNICLMEIRESIANQYKKIEERAKYSDSKQFDIVFIPDTEGEILKKLIEKLGEDLDLFFNCRKLKIEKPKTKKEDDLKLNILSSIKYNGTFKESKFSFQIKIFKSEKQTHQLEMRILLKNLLKLSRAFRSRWKSVHEFNHK